MKSQVLSFCLFLIVSMGESRYDFSVPYREKFIITCPLSHDLPFDQNIYWLLPSNELVSSNYSDDKFQISDYPAADLTIKSTTEDTFGVYNCFTVWKNKTLSMAGVGVNVDITLWHIKYKSKLIIGLITGAAFFVFFTLYCLICEFRYNATKHSDILMLDNYKLYETYENCGVNLTDESITDRADEESSKKDLSIEQANL